MSEPTNRKGEQGDRMDERVARPQESDSALRDDLSDEAFEAYLQRGSTVSNSYRAIEHEEPPAHLDANIFAHAQAELRTNTSQKYRRWKKWTLPVALAASTVMAVSIVLESGMQHEVRSVASMETLQQESPEPVGAPPSAGTAAVESAQAPSPAVAPNAESNPAFAPPSAPNATPSEAAEEQLFALEAPRPASPQSTASNDARSERAALDTVAAHEEREQKASVMRDSSVAGARSAKRSDLSARSAAAPMHREVPAQGDSAGQPESRVMAKQIEVDASQRSPAAWLEAIRSLRKAGKGEEADREWRAFKAAYADFEVAVDDVARPPNGRN